MTLFGERFLINKFILFTISSFSFHICLLLTQYLYSLDFNYLITAFDYKIHKEVWKSNVYSPWYSDSVNKTAVMLVQKLKSDKVL